MNIRCFILIFLITLCITDMIRQVEWSKAYIVHPHFVPPISAARLFGYVLPNGLTPCAFISSYRALNCPLGHRAGLKLCWGIGEGAMRFQVK